MNEKAKNYICFLKATTLIDRNVSKKEERIITSQSNAYCRRIEIIPAGHTYYSDTNIRRKQR